MTPAELTLRAIWKKYKWNAMYDELEDDLRHLINKYGRIMGWGGARSEHGGVPPIDS